MAQLEEVKKILRSLLVSAPVRVTVNSLNKDFKNLEGCYIPHRLLGYNSLLHMLHSLPDVLRVNGSSMESEVTLVITEKVAHVSDMVMKQKRPSKGRNARAPSKSVIRAPTSISCSFAVSKSRNDFAGITENKLNTSIVRNLDRLSPFPRPLLSRNIKPPCFTKRESENFHRTNSNLDDSYSTIESDNSKEYDSCTSYNVEESPRVPCLSKHMPHINPNEEPKIEKQKSSVKSRFEKLKLRMLRKMNTLNSDKIENKHFSRSSSEDEGISMIESEEDSKPPFYIQTKIKKFIKQHSSKIRCTDLPALYEQKHFKSLDHQKYGFDRSISVNSENIFYYQLDSYCDYKLNDVENPPLKKIEKENEFVFPNIAPETVDLSKIKGVKTKDWDTYADLIPQDSIKLGEAIDNTTINGYKVGDNIQIVVSDIYNPSKFWIYKDDGRLNEMMDTMQIFYRDHEQKYVIPEFLLEVGLYCVVYTQNEFQRAIIVDLLHEVGGYVKVYLIDFGTLINLEREQVRFLTKKFCSLPSQAVETSLAGIRPKDGAWSRQSVLRLKEMVTSRHVFGKVIDNRDGVVSLHTVASSMPLKTLNELLVKEGYAEYISNRELKSSTSRVSTASEEKNPRKKMIERLKMRRSLMKNTD